MVVTDSQQLKNKFGHLLSVLADNGITNESITETILTNAYFDLLESSNPTSFLKEEIPQICRDIFKYEPYFGAKNELISEYVWAAEAYLSLAFNLLMPLKQIFLLCPLSEMLKHYYVYHEKGLDAFARLFKEQYQTVSILKTLRQNAGLSLRQLAVLSSINAQSLLIYESSNQKLFNASHSTIESLAASLHLSISFFRKQSRFIPYGIFLFDIPSYRKAFVQAVADYQGISVTEMMVKNGDCAIDEARPLLRDYKSILVLGRRVELIRKKNGKAIVDNLDEFVLLAVHRKAYETAVFSSDKLLF